MRVFYSYMPGHLKRAETDGQKLFALRKYLEVQRRAETQREYGPYQFYLFCILFLCAFSVNTYGQIITTFAGNGTPGFSGDGGPATAAQLYLPSGAVADANGNIYISDCSNRRIRKVNSAGIITTFAGNGTSGYTGDGGPATAAQFIIPLEIAVDALGNVYVSDYIANVVRKINTAGIITTIAGNGTGGDSGDGGPATAAQLYQPRGIAVDIAGNVYIADELNHRLKKVNASGIISTIAGTGVWGYGYSGDGGPATAAEISNIIGITLDKYSNIYFADYNNNRIRMINTSGIISTVAGNGTAGYSGDGGFATAAELWGPQSIVFDGFGNLYLGEFINNRVRKINCNNIINLIAGTGAYSYSGDGGPATAATFKGIYEISIDKTGSLYVADPNNSCIRIVTFTNNPPTFIGGHNQSIAVCNSYGRNPIDTLLAITDADVCQLETWSVISAPLHGTLVATDTLFSTGDTLIPSGLSYSPAYGYIGVDSFTVRVSDGHNSDTTTVHILIKPSPVAITGVNHICIGFSSALSDASAGGTWTSGSTTVATVGSTGIFTGLSAGISVISYTIGSGCSAFDTVTVNALPPPITGFFTVCTGSTSSLTDTGSGSWSSSNTSIAIVGSSSGLLSGLSVGSATITYAFPTGCLATALISVYAVPTSISGRRSVCVGLTMTLSDGSPGGSWCSSNTAIATVGSSTGVVTGLSSGTSTITYMLATGCASTVTVTINPLPAVIAGSTSVCIGATTSLSDAAIGGVWSSGNTSVATIGSSSAIVASVSPGTTTITYTVPTGCIVTNTVTVNPLPVVIIGATHVCAGSTTLLSDGTTGGTWSSSYLLVATIGTSTGMVSGISSGTSTITYIAGTGCMATTVISVDSLPSNISGTMFVCTGTTTSLSDAGGGTWTANNTTIAIAGYTTGIITGMAAGKTTITYTLATGCVATVAVYVLSLPSAITGASALCVGTTAVLSDATGGGVWSSSNTFVATISLSGVVSGVAAGTSVITYKIFSTGCVTTKTLTVYASPGIIGVTHVCIGAPTILSDPATGGVWSSLSGGISVGSITGSVVGITAGTAIVTYSLGVGCSATITVTVNMLSSINGTSNICAGQTSALSDPAVGGAWSSSATTIVTIGTSTGVATGVSAGTATVTYLLPSGCFATTVVTVRPAPPPITGAESVCAGATTTLSDAATGGTWGVWGGIVTVGSATGVVTGITAGTAIITYSLGSGCTVTKFVTVNPTPGSITGVGSVCAGAATTLSDPTGGGVWSSGSGNVSMGSSSGIVTGVLAGTAIISYTLKTGCNSSRTETVNALPAAITGSADLCTGSTARLSTTTTGGTWSPTTGGVATVNAVTGIVTGISAGTAIITYTTGAGCTAATMVTVNEAPLSITGPSSVCVGSTITLSDLTTGGVWNAASGSVSVDSTTGIVTGITGGIANVTYSLVTGCNATKIILVNPISAINGATTLCAGSTTPLSDTVTGGSWTSSSPTVATIDMASGVVTGISGGAATITYHSPMGCTALQPELINALPDAGTIRGEGIVCVGATSTLSDPAVGGVWSAGSGSVAVDDVHGDVTGISVGTAIISYTVTNICGTALATYTITVDAIPTAGSITGSGSMCVAATTNLSDTITGGVWSAGSVCVAVGSTTGIVAGVSAGTAIVSYTVSGICGSVTTTHALTINPLPLTGTITGVSHVCAGASTTLSDTVTGGMWMAVNFNAIVSGGLVAGVSAGTDTILYQTTNSCGTASAVYSMTVDPLPDAGVITGAGSVCVGASTTLSDPSAGGVWNSGSGSMTVGSGTGVVTGISAGSAVVTYTLVNICGTGTVTHSVTINPLPLAGAITGSGSVCVGETITLSEAATSGIWHVMNGNASIGPATGIVTGIAAGTDTIKYSVTNICGMAVAVWVVTVNPMPDAGAIANVGTLCVGATMALSDLVSGGAWRTADGNATIDSVTGIVTGVSAGSSIVTYYVTNICGDAAATMAINVLSPPIVSEIAGLSVECIGASVSLTDTTSGGIWYSNSLSNITSVGSSTGIVTGISAGVDTVLYTVSNFCGSITARKEMIINPLPDGGVITGSDSLCAGDTIGLADDVPAGVWGNNNAAIASLLSQSVGTAKVIGIAQGNDNISYTVTNICGSSSALFAVHVRPGSDCNPLVKTDSTFDCSGSGELIIYPNPNPGTFTINVSSDTTERVTIIIINMLGQRHKLTELLTNAPLEITLSEPPGIYILSMTSARGKCSKKFTIVR